MEDISDDDDVAHNYFDDAIHLPVSPSNNNHNNDTISESTAPPMVQPLPSGNIMNGSKSDETSTLFTRASQKDAASSSIALPVSFQFLPIK